jgi:hypothetical protein
MEKQLREVVRNGGGNAEVSPIVKKYSAAFSQKKLRRATPKTMKNFVRYRMDLLKLLYDCSPTYMYTMIFKENIPFTDKDDDIRQELVRRATDMTNILIVSESEKPIPQNDKLAETLFQQVAQSLSKKDLKLIGDHSPDSDGSRLTDPAKIKDYCDAYFRMYEKMLALDDDKALQVLRYIDGILPDDRLAAK